MALHRSYSAHGELSHIREMPRYRAGFERGSHVSLESYTGDGRLAIDNNPAERSLRGIAVTRKNFLFVGSEAGGERAAVLYTVLETAKLNGHDPEAYLANVIDRMAKGHPINQLAQLLPWSAA